MKQTQPEQDFLRSEIARLQSRLREITDSSRLDIINLVAVIEFDGGTSCNIPAKGFGNGYGSYKINDQEIVRVKFGNGHSCNSAEIMTAHAAALDLLDQLGEASRSASVLFRGDSQIALKWINPKFRKTPKPSGSVKFIEAIRLIREVNHLFGSIRCEWRGRQHSVDLFGH